MDKILISDESVNSYGLRVITAGIDLTAYKKNPILLWMHFRAWKGTKDEILPLGRIINLEIQDGKLYGEPEFDLTDPFAKQISEKYEKGFIKAASAGIDPKEWSDDPMLLLPGQTRPSLTKSVLMEVSLVDIPSNENCVKLYTPDHKMVEDDKIDNLIELNFKPTNKPIQMKKVALLLGLLETATEDQIHDAVKKMQDSIQAKDTELLQFAQKQAETLVDGAIAAKKISAEKRETFLTLAKTNFAQAKEIIDGISVSVKPMDVINQGGGKKPEDAALTLKSLMDKGADEYEKFKKENATEFAAMYKEHYGVAYNPAQK